MASQGVQQIGVSEAAGKMPAARMAGEVARIRPDRLVLDQPWLEATLSESGAAAACQLKVADPCAGPGCRPAPRRVGVLTGDDQVAGSADPLKAAAGALG
jgi:hypothetical protein